MLRSWLFLKKDIKISNKILILLVGIIIVIICAFLVNAFIDNGQNIYKFDFYDGYEPGAKYTGKINLTTGKVQFKVVNYCSLPNCHAKNSIVKGKLNEEQLELVKAALNNIEDSNRGMLLKGVSYFIRGDEICYKGSNITCNEEGKHLLKMIIRD